MKSWHFLIYTVVALLGFSIVAIYSTDTSSFRSSGNGDQFLKHLLWVLIGSALLIVMAKVDYHYLYKWSPVILGVSFVFLVMVLIPGIGTVTNGARRWMRLGSILGFQPSEFAKLAMVIFIASYIARNHGHMSAFVKGFVIPVSITGLISFLVLAEPDFGTAAFITLISIIILVIGGTRLIFLFFIAISLIPFLYSMIFDVEYRRIRLLSHWNPWKDPSGTGYHIIQSWIAMGSGGLTGTGIGNSRQKLFFLPESGSDFIFTIIGEEFGFIGVIVVISLFSVLVWQGLKIVHKARDSFGFFLGLGITVMLGLQAIVNIAVVSGVLPTKGIPLPFVSYGGSSLIFSMIGVGILINIARRSDGVKVTNAPAISEDVNGRNRLLFGRVLYKLIARIAGFSW